MPSKKAAKKPAPKAAKKKPAAAKGPPARRAPEPTPQPPAPPRRPPAPKPTYAPPPPPAPPAPPAPPTPAADPEFVKRASFADRKAALEALAEKEGLPTAAPAPAESPPRPPPTFVKETSAADRKAAMEKVVVEQGVTGILSKAPWKRATPPPAPAPAPPVERTAPRVQMTKSPIEQTTGRNPPSSVILDSNALMMQFQFHIDIEREVNRLLGGNYRMVVPQIVVDELGRLAKEGNTKEAAEARMAAELAKTFRIVESPGDGDVGILRLAESLNAIVVTNDKRLRATLRAKGIPNIYMRSRAFLTIEGHVPGL